MWVKVRAETCPTIPLALEDSEREGACRHGATVVCHGDGQGVRASRASIANGDGSAGLVDGERAGESGRG